MISAPLSAALELANTGTPCFPCLADKRPATPKGFKDATSDPTRLDELWRQYPGALVGIPTGEASGVDVVDVDPRNGGNIWLNDVQVQLPITRVVETRSGGWHLYFVHETGIRNSAGRIAPGVDVRGEGGYVIHWPAAGFRILCDAPIAAWPTWLFDILCRGDGNPSGGIQRRPPDYWQKIALGVPEGRRNDGLTSLTGKLLHAGIEPHLALALLRSFNATHVKPPLPENEVDSIFCSIAKTWMRSRSL